MSSWLRITIAAPQAVPRTILHPQRRIEDRQRLDRRETPPSAKAFALGAAHRACDHDVGAKDSGPQHRWPRRQHAAFVAAVWRCLHAESRVPDPSPTYVAGFHQWRDLGRSVMKGQSGLPDLRPGHRRVLAVPDSRGRQHSRSGEAHDRVVAAQSQLHSYGSVLRQPRSGDFTLSEGWRRLAKAHEGTLPGVGKRVE